MKQIANTQGHTKIALLNTIHTNIVPGVSLFSGQQQEVLSDSSGNMTGSKSEIRTRTESYCPT